MKNLINITRGSGVKLQTRHDCYVERATRFFVVCHSLTTVEQSRTTFNNPFLDWNKHISGQHIRQIGAASVNWVGLKCDWIARKEVCH